MANVHKHFQNVLNDLQRDFEQNIRINYLEINIVHDIIVCINTYLSFFFDC